MGSLRFGKNCIVIAIFVAAFLLAGIAAAETKTAAIGDRVPLSGKAVGYDVVYLFMTGPGVPSSGSRMDSSVSPVVTGNPNTFTQVPVNDGYWNYTWNTGKVSGGLAEGDYTVYSATQPVSAQDLSGVPYSSIDVVLYRPVTTGSISVTSTPSRAQVMVNGKYSGDTPLNLTSLTPGTYEIEVSLQGYIPARQTIPIQAGDRKEADFILQPAAPATTAATIPSSTTPQPTESIPPPTTKASLSLPLIVIGLGIFACLGNALKRR